MKQFKISSPFEQIESLSFKPIKRSTNFNADEIEEFIFTQVVSDLTLDFQPDVDYKLNYSSMEEKMILNMNNDGIENIIITDEFLFSYMNLSITSGFGAYTLHTCLISKDDFYTD